MTTTATALAATATDLDRLYYRLNGKRRPLDVRTPATIDPDDRERWRGHAGSYAHLGRDIEAFVRDAHNLGPHGKRATRTLARTAIEREIAALRSELGDIFPAPADQPLPMVRFSQAGVASVRGGL